jgi:hypothetical protein
MLSAGQSAGNILPTTSLFIFAKRKLKRIFPLTATAEVKLRNRNEPLPHWPNEAFSCLHGLENKSGGGHLFLIGIRGSIFFEEVAFFFRI